MSNKRLSAVMTLSLVLALLASGCVTTAAPEPPVPTFAGFPQSFKAIQILTIKHSGTTDQVLANLVRQGDHYDVTFMQPLLQLPLVEIVSSGGHNTVTKFQELPATFPGDEIMASIRALYPATVFVGEPGALTFADQRFTYRMEDFGKFPGCAFPKTIAMIPVSTVAAAAVAMTIETKELLCE